MAVCRCCHGRGVQYVESGSSLCYTCPDCNGNGWLPECDMCGEVYYGDYCDECYAECEECGEVSLIDELKDGLCECCAEFLMEEEAK